MTANALEATVKDNYQLYIEEFGANPIIVLPEPYELYKQGFLDCFTSFVETRAIEETEKPKLRRRGK